MNRKSSVSVVRLEVRPKRPPIRGILDKIGTPDCETSRCLSVKPPITTVCPSFTSSRVCSDRVEITGASKAVSFVAEFTFVEAAFVIAPEI